MQSENTRNIPSVPSMLLADLDLAFVFPIATTHNVYVRSFGYETILFHAAQVCLHYC